MRTWQIWPQMLPESKYITRKLAALPIIAYSSADDYMKLRAYLMIKCIALVGPTAFPGQFKLREIKIELYVCESLTIEEFPRRRRSPTRSPLARAFGKVLPQQ